MHMQIEIILSLFFTPNTTLLLQSCVFATLQYVLEFGTRPIYERKILEAICMIDGPE